MCSSTLYALANGGPKTVCSNIGKSLKIRRCKRAQNKPWSAVTIYFHWKQPTMEKYCGYQIASRSPIIYNVYNIIWIVVAEFKPPFTPGLYYLAQPLGSTYKEYRGITHMLWNIQIFRSQTSGPPVISIWLHLSIDIIFHTCVRYIQAVMSYEIHLCTIYASLR